jgi:hypothetical protein
MIPKSATVAKLPAELVLPAAKLFGEKTARGAIMAALAELPKLVVENANLRRENEKLWALVHGFSASQAGDGAPRPGLEPPEDLAPAKPEPAVARDSEIVFDTW